MSVNLHWMLFVCGVHNKHCQKNKDMRGSSARSNWLMEKIVSIQFVLSCNKRSFIIHLVDGNDENRNVIFRPKFVYLKLDTHTHTCQWVRFSQNWWPSTCCVLSKSNKKEKSYFKEEQLYTVHCTDKRCWCVLIE